MAKKHDYDGACKPSSCFDTFSVGVFKWISRARGEGMKRGKVKVRVSGKCKNAEAVYDRARKIVVALDDGVYDGPKNVKVKL